MATTFEELFRDMQEFEDAIDDDGMFIPSLSEREQLFAGRVAMIAKRLASKIDKGA